jgi:hypothetical protein
MTDESSEPDAPPPEILPPKPPPVEGSEAIPASASTVSVAESAPSAKSAWLRGLHHLKEWEPLLSAVASFGTLLIALLALSYYKPEAQRQVDDANKSAARILLQAQVSLNNAQTSLNNANAIDWLASKENAREEAENVGLAEANRNLDETVSVTQEHLSALNSQIQEAQIEIEKQNSEISFVREEEQRTTNKYNITKARISVLNHVKSRLELSLANETRSQILDAFLSQITQHDDELRSITFFESNDTSLQGDRILMESGSGGMAGIMRNPPFFYSQGLTTTEFEEPLYYGFPGSFDVPSGAGGFGQIPVTSQDIVNKFQTINRLCPMQYESPIQIIRGGPTSVELCRIAIVPRTIDPLHLYVLLIAEQVMMDAQLGTDPYERLGAIDPETSDDLKRLDETENPKIPQIIESVFSIDQVAPSDRNNPQIKIVIRPAHGTSPNPLPSQDTALILQIANEVAEKAIEIEPDIEKTFNPMATAGSLSPDTTTWRIEQLNNHLFCNWKSLVLSDGLLNSSNDGSTVNERKAELLDFFFIEKPPLPFGTKLSSFFEVGQRAELNLPLPYLEQDDRYELWSNLIDGALAPGESFDLGLALTEKSYNVETCFKQLALATALLERGTSGGQPSN